MSETSVSPAETLRAAAGQLLEGRPRVEPDLTVEFPDLDAVRARVMENYAFVLDRDPEFTSPSLTAVLAVARAVLGEEDGS